MLIPVILANSSQTLTTFKCWQLYDNLINCYLETTQKRHNNSSKSPKKTENNSINIERVIKLYYSYTNIKHSKLNITLTNSNTFFCEIFELPTPTSYTIAKWSLRKEIKQYFERAPSCKVQKCLATCR